MIQHPRIGIRPTIDGRRQGVRESLEVQTMNMAKSVADLISSTLKYPDGEPVECVISPSTIGRVPEAATSHELFKKSNVCATITVTPCWCYGSETMDMSPDIPHAIWGFNGTERPGAVYLAAVLASHAQKGIPAFGIYGRDVQEANDTDIPEDVHHTLDNRTDPGWPTTWFAPRLTGKGAFKSVYDVMNNWGANHGAITYGHIGADLITLASMLRIPVNMHNVPEEDIFRPKNWSLFGTEDLESADYRACQLLGPLHK
ncbi:TPA: hypothetical protein VW110_001252 [Streptococcus pneumoniae]|nr:hypothetical protein [Streptococcus pneumoniae]